MRRVETLGRNAIVKTGTGSGKTEAFLLALFSGILKLRADGVKGTKTILLYPMNALANDQLGRLRKLIRHSGLGITFAMYTGESESVAATLGDLIYAIDTIGVKARRDHVDRKGRAPTARPEGAAPGGARATATALQPEGASRPGVQTAANAQAGHQIPASFGPPPSSGVIQTTFRVIISSSLPEGWNHLPDRLLRLCEIIHRHLSLCVVTRAKHIRVLCESPARGVSSRDGGFGRQVAYDWPAGTCQSWRCG